LFQAREEAAKQVLSDSGLNGNGSLQSSCIAQGIAAKVIEFSIPPSRSTINKF
jgi:hypothetical protein